MSATTTRQANPSSTGFTIRAAVLAAANIVALAMSFLLPLIIVRRLSPADFGLYKQVFQVLATMVGILGLHVSTSAYYFMPRHEEKKAQVAFNIILFYVGVGALTSIVFAMFPGIVSGIFKTGDIKALVPLIGLAVPLWLVSSLLDVVPVADKQVRLAAVFILSSQLLKTGLLVASVIVFGTVRSLLIAAVVFGGLQCCVMTFYLWRRYGEFWRQFDGQLFKAQLSNSLPYGAGALLFNLQDDLHNYMVSHYFDASVFAVYSVGCFDLPLLNVLLDSVGRVLIPELARLEMAGNNQAVAEVWSSWVRRLALLFVPSFGFLLLMRREFILALFTPQYSAAIPIFAINITTILLRVLITGPVLRAFSRYRYFRLRLCILLLPASWLSIYAGIKIAGPVGAITAVVLVQLLDAAITLAAVRRAVNFSFRPGPIAVWIARISVASAGAGICTYLVRASVSNAGNLTILVICAGVFGLAYGALAFLSGAVTRSERAELRVLFNRLYRSGYAKLGLLSAEG
jgi:O-antigen/teichoic acid export membrane protein